MELKVGMAMLAALMAGGLPTVTDTAVCPTAPEVEAALAAQLPQGSWPNLRLSIAPVAESPAPQIELALWGRSALRPVAQQRLSARGSCAGLAAAIAVVVVAWLESSSLQSEPAPDRLVVSPAPAPGERRPGAAATWRKGLALLGGLAGGGQSIAASLRLEGHLEPPLQGPGLLLAVVGDTDRTLEIGFAGATWKRLFAALGADWLLWSADPRAASPTAALRLGAELLAGGFWSQGRGYATDRPGGGPEAGAEVELELRVPLLGQALLLRAAGQAWPLLHTLTAPGASAQLPTLEFNAAAGLLWWP